MTRSADTIQDEMLVLAAQGGDTAAFETLLRRWLPVMRRHAARLTGNAGAAEDVSQEACVALVGAIRRLRDPAWAYGWMLRIVTHKAVDWIRRRAHDRDLAETLRNREPRTPSNDFQGTDEPGEKAARIRAACLELPHGLRAVVSLHYGEGMPVAAIAAAFGAPAGTIKSRLHEAREQLRTILERSPT